MYVRNSFSIPATETLSFTNYLNYPSNMQTPEVNIQEKAESPLDQGVLDLPTNQEPEKNKTFGSIVARTITGVLYVVAIVLCIQHPMAFLILFAALTGLCTWEFCTIVNIGLRINSNRFITTIAAVYFFFAIFDFITGLTGAGVGVFIPFVITIMYLLVSELYMKGFRKIENWAFSFMALFYIALPMSMLNMLAFIGVETGLAYVTVFTLSVFIFLWSSDTGAYVIGSKFGKHRLFPSISPKKSWEGSVGGGVVALIASQIVACFSHDLNADSELLNRLLWAGLALVVVVFGTWGDLVESRLKRKLGVKDSGNILPGHGGWLDRLDSALMAIPAAVIYLYLI